MVGNSKLMLNSIAITEVIEIFIVEFCTGVRTDVFYSIVKNIFYLDEPIIK